MKLEIFYIDIYNQSHTKIVELINDDIEIIENYFNNEIGYYPNTVIVKKLED